MVLSDPTTEDEIAKGRRVVEALDLACIEPAIIDTYLDNGTLVFKTWCYPFYINVKQNADDLPKPPLDLVNCFSKEL
jgi:hypothetical protein